MISNDKPAGPVSSSNRRARRFRITGVIVLVLGILAFAAFRIANVVSLRELELFIGWERGRLIYPMMLQ